MNNEKIIIRIRKIKHHGVNHDLICKINYGLQIARMVGDIDAINVSLLEIINQYKDDIEIEIVGDYSPEFDDALRKQKLTYLRNLRAEVECKLANAETAYMTESRLDWLKQIDADIKDCEDKL